MTSGTFSVDQETRVGTFHKCSEPQPLERVRVWLHNLWHWRTAWAVRHLCKQLQRDKAFRDSWQANIAMPMWDTTKLDRKECNRIANMLIKHLFNA